MSRARTGKTSRQTKRPEITETDVQALKYFDKLAPLLQRLHDEGCERDTANNRTLHFDQYCMLMLFYLFSPIVTSLRRIQQASELEKVQRKLGYQRTSLGSLSEATSVFDAQSLKEIIAELGDQLQPLAQDKRLTDIQQAITPVDGTLIAALPGIIEASWRKANCGNGMVKWRLHTHFERLRGVPTRIDATPNGGGEHDERAVLEAAIESDRLYVGDRGYVKFALFNKPHYSTRPLPPTAATSADCETTECANPRKKNSETTPTKSTRSSATRVVTFSKQKAGNGPIPLRPPL